MTDTPLEFTSGVRRDEPLTFSLDGKSYTIRPAKKAIVVLLNKFFWFDASLNAHDWSLMDDDAKRATAELEPTDEVPASWPEDWYGPQSTELSARLRDPMDRFDTDTLEKVVDGLLEQISGRPTT